MHQLFGCVIPNLVKIDKYVTVKRFYSVNKDGMYLFGINQSKKLFYSRHKHPFNAYIDYCNRATSVTIDGHRIVRIGLVDDKNRYMVDNQENIMFSSSNIHYAFIQWKIQQDILNF